MLDSSSSLLCHRLQNSCLVVLSVLCLPLTTILLILSYFAGLFIQLSVYRNRSTIWQDHSFQPKVILVTGVGMTKGLVIARLLFEAGHTVIGADFEPHGNLVCGRVSRALKRFHRLQQPNGSTGSMYYIQNLLTIIEQEKVDLWVSCSGVVSAVKDGEAKKIIEARTPCKAIQFDMDTTHMLHEKHTFIEYTRSIGLNVPETHRVSSRDEAEKILLKTPSSRKFIMKPVGVDDSLRGDMTLLPKADKLQTSKHLARLNISKTNPWVLQQYIHGSEFCTHSLVIQGAVMAFVACPSTELLMHYQSLPFNSKLSQEMLNFTQQYARSFGGSFTGHLSFDFLVEEKALQDPENLVLFPIECNPRAHTAVVLFDNATKLGTAYTSHLEVNSTCENLVVMTPENNNRLYWVGHDLITLVLIPVYSFVTLDLSFTKLLQSLKSFVNHILFWKDGTFELWDPLPFWWLYHVYWPMQFLSCIRSGRRWSRINVSTTKMFEC